VGQKAFVRQKTIYCGPQYREIDLFTYTSEQKAQAKRKRGAKEKISEPKQKNLNDRNSKRYATQLMHANFGPKDLHVSLTYTDDTLPKSVEEAERICSNYIRRLQHARKKLGLPPLKYIKVTSCKDGRDGTPARLHHHLIMSGGLDRDFLEKKWGLGYADADRLQMINGSLADLSYYITKQSGGKKSWTSSTNLIRPYARSNDSRWSIRTLDKLAKERPTREYWESRFPGWTLTDKKHGAEYLYNDVTASWGIYLKLRRKE
jgi:hypothetical protein